MTHVYIIHGYSASPEDHWFLWLEKKLLQDNVLVTRVHLPNSKSPHLNDWLKELEQKVLLNDEAYIVAHSLGCITAVRYISRMNIPIGGAIFVSGFDRRLVNLPVLDEFVKDIPDIAQAGSLITQKLTILSRDDTIVPPSYTEHFALNINSQLIEFKQAGHFLASDGFDELPVVYNNLKLMIKA